MPKKKSIPDNRPQALESHYYHPTESDSSSIATKYGFVSDYALKEKLEFAFMIEESIRSYQQSETQPKEQRDMLKLLLNSASVIEEILTNLGTNEINHLLDSMLLEKSISLSVFKQDLTHIRWATAAALGAMKNEKGVRSKKENVWYLVSRLADIWLEGKQESPTIGYDDISGEYVGEFYHFVCECADLGSIHLSNGNPGSSIKNIIQNWRNKQK